MTKKELSNKSEKFWNAAPQQKPKKVIMMLVDALREDFVQFEKDGDDTVQRNPHHFLNVADSVYKGKKIELFQKLIKNEPENSILLPMEAEMPTVTTVRIKAIMTGALSSFFETKEDFAHDEVPEDSVLYQVKNHMKNSTERKIIFSGDHIWIDMFGNLFDKETHYPSFNVRDLDTNDLNVHNDVLNVLNEKEDFNLLVCHLIGIDHAGHTFFANHTEIQRKIIESEVIIEQIV
jgi:phosphatidylinositol glycan class O